MSAPRVLLLAMRDDWLGPPRLAGALRDAGLEVAAICPAEGPLAASSRVQKLYRFSREQPPSLPMIQNALDDWQPARVLPMDDASVLLLRRLVQMKPPLPAQHLAYLQAGGVDPAAQSEWLDKVRGAELARAAGLSVPDWRRVEAGAELPRDVAKLGAPLVVKPLIGYGGVGVRVVDAADLAGFAKPPRPLMLQRFVVGTTWACGFYAERGRLLAALCVAKERTHPPVTGPSSRLRFEARPELRAAAERLVASRNYSGFGSIDCQIDATGRVWFLECNPRPTPFLHLGARVGPDPAAALAAVLAMRDYAEPTLQRERWRVALYPQELQRDPQGVDLDGADWDRPDDDTGLGAWLREWLARQG